MKDKMLYQTAINPVEREKIQNAVLKAYARTFGTPKDITINCFPISPYPTSSIVTGVRVTFREKVGVEYRPFCIYKRFLEGVRKTSDHISIPSDARKEFERERELLRLGIEHPKRHIKPYPELYSKDVPECDKDMIIVREFMEEEDKLTSIADAQLKAKKGCVRWVAPIGTRVISDFLYPIAMQHISSDVIANYFKRNGLLDQSPGEVDPVTIAVVEETKILSRIDRLLLAYKKRHLPENKRRRLGELFRPVFAQFFGRKGLQRIINGDLDVFPHNATYNKILDSNAEVGPYTRDIAVFSDPKFRSLWIDEKTQEEKPVLLAQLVVSDYENIFRMLEEELLLSPPSERSRELVELSFLLACASGNLRTATTISNYRLLDEGGRVLKEPSDKIMEEARNYLSNSFNFFQEFGDVVGGGTQKDIKEILDIFKEGLGDPEKYVIPNRNSSKNTRKGSEPVGPVRSHLQSPRDSMVATKS